MRAAPAQHIDVHLPRGDEEGVRVPRRNDRVPVREPDAQTAVRDDFAERGGDRVACFWGRGVGLALLLGIGVGGEWDVEVAFD